MEKIFASEFINKAGYIIGNKEDKDIFFASLHDYRDYKNVFRLVARLKYLINNPQRLALIELVRTMISDSDQISFDKACYWLPRTLGSYLHGENHYRLVKISRRSRRSSKDSVASSVVLGFAVRGGLEHGTGIFVSHVSYDSIAWREGLRIGDQILRVNGLPLDQATHTEATNIIRNAGDLQLKVRRIGMIPSRKHSTSKVKWKFCSDLIRNRAQKMSNDHDTQLLLHKYKEEEKNRPLALSLNMSSEEFSLGCTVRSMPSDETVQPNRIFIQSVNKNGLATKVGLQPGDEILAANHVLLRGLSHADVMIELKKCAPLDLLIKQQNPTPIPESELLTEEQQLRTKSKWQLGYSSYRPPSRGFITETVSLSNQNDSITSDRRSHVIIVKEEPNPKFTYTTAPSIPLLTGNVKFGLTNGENRSNDIRTNHMSTHGSYNERGNSLPPKQSSSQHSMQTASLPRGSCLPSSPVLLDSLWDKRKTELITLHKNEYVRGFGFTLEEGHGEMFNNKFAVSSVQEHSPAYQSGISRGDFVLEIDGKELSKMPSVNVQTWLRDMDADESLVSVQVKVAKISQEIYWRISEMDTLF